MVKQISLILNLLAVLLSSVTSSEKALIDFFFAPCKCQCGLPNRGDRLLGGEYLKNYEFPWLGTIQAPNQNIQGTLINDKYLLTSASRLRGLTPNELTVIFGQDYKCSSNASHTNVINVDSIIIHPSFNPESYAHDIALLKLSTQVKIKRELSPICLGRSGLGYTGQVATVTGWSNKQTEDDSALECQLKKIGIPVLGKEECSHFMSQSKSTSDQSCLGIYDFASPVCESEEGGPVMYRSYKGVYELIGILSNGNRCTSDPNVAFFTRIGDHLPWITEVTKDACYCLKFYR